MRRSLQSMLSSCFASALCGLWSINPCALAQTAEALEAPQYRSSARVLLGDSPVRVTDYGLGHGLETLDIGGLAEGPDGRLWVGSLGGVFTFDGVYLRLQEDPVAPSSTGGSSDGEALRDGLPPLSYGQSLVRDGRGRMWVATDDGEVYCHWDGSFKVMDDLGACEGPATLLAVRDGSVFGRGYGVVRFSGDGPELIIDPNESLDLVVSAICQAPSALPGDDSELVWICTNEGIYQWGAELGLKLTDSEPASALFFDQSGRRWCLRPGGAEASIEGSVCNVPCALWDFRTAIPIDRDRTLVVMWGGSYIADFNGGEPRLEPFDDQGLIVDAVATENGAVWITVDGKGLRYIEPLSYEPIVLTGKEGADWMVVRPRDATHALVGSWDSGVIWDIGFDPLGPQVQSAHRLDWIDGEGTSSEQPMVFDFSFEGDGPGYVVSDRGLFTIENRPGGVEDQELIWINETATTDGRMVRDKSSGHLWVRRQEFLVEYSGSRATGRKFELQHPTVTQLAAHGDKIFAFQKVGVVEFDTTTMTSRLALPFSPQCYGTLFAQENGDIWAPTDGLGLFRLSRDGKVDHWTTEHGLPTDFMGWACTVPGPTESSHLWVNSNAGAMAISLKSLEATARGELEWLDCHLMRSGESLGADGAALANGMLILPTFDGPIVIDTHVPLPTHSPPRLQLGALRADGVPIHAGDRLVGAKAIEFEYDAVQLPFRIGSEVQYRLEGHDEDWIASGHGRLARYGSLGPGKYRFQLRARSAGTQFSPVVSGPTIKIVPHWYESRPVQGALLLVMGLLGVATFRRRTQRLVNRSRELNELVDRLSVSEERYRRLFRTAPTAIIMCTADGGVLEWNDAASRLFIPTCAPRGEPVCSLVDLLADPQDGAQMLEKIEEAATDGGAAPFKLETKSGGDSSRPCVWQLASIPGHSQPTRRLIALVEDKADEERAAHDLLKLRRQLARAEEMERSRIARELHDDLSQRLAALSMNLRWAKDAVSAETTPMLVDALEESCEGIEELSRGVHSLSRRLHPAVLDDLGLSAALRSECHRREGIMDAKITLQDDGGSNDVRGEVGLALFRVAQEALQNASKHSGTQGVTVRLQRFGDDILLEVEDRGQGFDDNGNRGGGLGLSSMSERMSLIGGGLVIHSAPGEGTVVRATATFTQRESSSLA